MLQEPIALNITGYRITLKQTATNRTVLLVVNGSAVTNYRVEGLLPKSLYQTSITTIMRNKDLYEGKSTSFETLAAGATHSSCEALSHWACLQSLLVQISR